MTFNEELTIATVGSLLGSVIGALVGAGAAYYASRRLFENEFDAREKSEREARHFDRRLTETRVVEEWNNALTKDFGALLTIHMSLVRVTKEGVGLDPSAWPIHRLGHPTRAPILVGPLKSLFDAANEVVWQFHDAVGRDVREHREGRDPHPNRAVLLSRKFCEAQDALTEALRAELRALTEPTS